MTRMTIIFDFDGTIADSFNTIVSVYNEIGKEFHLKRLSPKEAVKLRDLTPKEVIRALKISLFTLPLYLLRGRALIKKHINDVKPIEGIIPVIHELSKKYSLGVLTSNNKDTVEIFLKKNSLESFQFIHSERNIFGKHKALESLIKKYDLKKEETVYVGDEVRDIECCRKAHVPIVSVSWGLNSAELLKKYNPDYLFTKPEELLTL